MSPSFFTVLLTSAFLQQQADYLTRVSTSEHRHLSKEHPVFPTSAVAPGALRWMNQQLASDPDISKSRMVSLDHCGDENN